MYQLVIADDEKRIREGLRKVIDWESLGFTVTELFSDGQEVIDYLELMEPDVILTDIKMSTLSGIDVAKYVHEHHLSCKVVLISGYQEFELAREGLRYGVEEYLLKPTKVEKLEETFTKIKLHLDESLITRQRQVEKKRQLEDSIALLEERFWADVIMGVVDNDSYIRNCVSILYPEIDPDQCECFLMDLTIQNYDLYFGEIWEYGADSFEMYLKDYLRFRRKEYLFQLVYKSDNTIELIGMKQKDAASQREDAVDLLLMELKEAFDLSVDARIFDSCTNIFEIRAERDARLSSQEDASALTQNLKEQKLLLITNISIGNIATAQKLFHSILTETKGIPKAQQINVVVDIMTAIYSVLCDIGGSLAESFRYITDGRRFGLMKDTDEILMWADRVFDQLKLANMQTDGLASSLMERAKLYIRENIGRDISQEETANHLYISSSYLSRLFRKQTGETYMQYVTRIKMERAIELLKEPQYKTYQVGEMLGYKTSRYFSKLFHAHTGMNPGEYRKRVLHLGGDYEKTKT